MFAQSLKQIPGRARRMPLDLPDVGRTIRTPADMVSLLRRSCPDDAADYARRTHERVCLGHDEERTRFWHEVADLLSQGPEEN